MSTVTGWRKRQIVDSQSYPSKGTIMKRPLEQDYASLVAYTRALEQFCDALAQPEQEPVQDSTCNETLRGQGKAYPRTCKKCGLGPCVGKPKSDTTPPQRKPPTYCEECMRPNPADETACAHGIKENT
jgi:hypothetical protein